MGDPRVPLLDGTFHSDAFVAFGLHRFLPPLDHYASDRQKLCLRYYFAKVLLPPSSAAATLSGRERPVATSTKVVMPAYAPDLQGHPVLLNHRTQSATAINGWSSVFFGVPFLAAGVFIAALALNGSRAGKSAPGWLIELIAGTFFSGGTFFVVHGIRGVIRKSAYLREAARRPSEPWLYDFHWRREGITFSAFDDMRERLLAAMVWTTFLVPFAWVGMNVHGAWPFLVAVAIFGLLGLVFWFRWAQMVLDLVRYGSSFLSYESLPFALGGTLRARLRSPHHVSAIDELTLTLRCVQEKYVTSGTGENRTTRVVCYEVYKDVTTCNRDRLRGLAGNDIPIEFLLPADEPATNLAATPPVYWEIEARGKARGVNYEAVFLVPVYKAS